MPPSLLVIAPVPFPNFRHLQCGKRDELRFDGLGRGHGHGTGALGSCAPFTPPAEHRVVIRRCRKGHDFILPVGFAAISGTAHPCRVARNRPGPCDCLGHGQCVFWVYGKLRRHVPGCRHPYGAGAAVYRCASRPGCETRVQRRRCCQGHGVSPAVSLRSLIAIPGQCADVGRYIPTAVPNLVTVKSGAEEVLETSRIHSRLEWRCQQE